MSSFRNRRTRTQSRVLKDKKKGRDRNVHGRMECLGAEHFVRVFFQVGVVDTRKPPLITCSSRSTRHLHTESLFILPLWPSGFDVEIFDEQRTISAFAGHSMIRRWTGNCATLSNPLLRVFVLSHRLSDISFDCSELGMEGFFQRETGPLQAERLKGILDTGISDRVLV